MFRLLLVAGSSAFALAYPMVLGHDWQCQDQDGRLDFAVASREDFWVAAARYVGNGRSASS